MTNHPFMQRIFIVLVLLFACTIAQAQRGRTVYTVPNTSFVPDLNYGYSNGNAGDGIAYADGGTAVRLVASVQLPLGAILDSAVSYFVDNSDADMYITLASYENAVASGLKDFFTSTTSGKSSSVRS